MNEDIKFWLPAEIEKAGEGKDEVLKMKGVASTATRDSDGEILKPDGFDLSFFKSAGFVNWHHQTKSNPLAVIGEPVRAEIVKGNFEVEVDLYKSSPLAQETYQLAEILKSDSKTRKLGFSIEGKVLERDKNDKKTITKARITGLAITHMPKNPSTLAEIVKGEVDGSEMEFENDIIASFDENELYKSESSGESGSEKSDEKKGLNTESGEALKKEDLEGSEERKKKKKEKDKKETPVKDVTTEKTYKKSEAIEKIKADFPELEKGDEIKIYNLVNKMSRKMGKEITDENFEKAYDALGLEKDEEIQKSEEFVDIMKGIDGLKEFIKGGNESTNEIIKGMGEKYDALEEKYDTLLDKIEEIGNQPSNIRKSVVSSRQIERFEKAETETPALSASGNKGSITRILEDMTFEKGQMNDEMANVLRIYDSSKFLSPKVRDIIKQRKGIAIVD